MTKEQPNLQPRSMIPTMVTLTNDMVSSSSKQLANFEKAKDQPHVLDNAIIVRSLKLYKEQKEQTKVFLNQCSIWRKEALTNIESAQVRAIEDNILLLVTLNHQILEILDYCKELTIDKILKKEGTDLSWDFFGGKPPYAQ